MEEAGWQGHSNKQREGLDTAMLALTMEEGTTSSNSLKPHWIFTDFSFEIHSSFGLYIVFSHWPAATLPGVPHGLFWAFPTALCLHYGAVQHRRCFCSSLQADILVKLSFSCSWFKHKTDFINVWAQRDAFDRDNLVSVSARDQCLLSTYSMLALCQALTIRRMNAQGHCPQEAQSMRATVRSVSDKVKGKRATHKVLWGIRRKNE